MKKFVEVNSWTQTAFKRAKFGETTALETIEINPELFLGVSSFAFVNILANRCEIPVKPLCICLQKIRLNQNLKQLSFHFNQAEQQVRQIVTDLIPIICQAVKNLLQWPNPGAIFNCLVADEREKQHFCQFGSILRVCQVSEVEKFIVSITPLGTVNFVSKVFPVELSNSLMLEQSNFKETDLASEKRQIILTEDLMDVFELMETSGFSVLLKIADRVENDSFRDDIVDRIVANAEITLQAFKRFQILNHYKPSDFEETNLLNQVVIIVAALINAEILSQTKI